MRNTLAVLLSVLVCGSVAAESDAEEQGSITSPTHQGGLQIEIQSPTADLYVAEGETGVEVEGIASAIGGVRYLDMIFVMDTSQSLRSTDPSDYRSAGAVGLVRNLSPRSDIKIGVVSFDSKGDLVQRMTSEREKVVAVLAPHSRIRTRRHQTISPKHKHGRRRQQHRIPNTEPRTQRRINPNRRQR